MNAFDPNASDIAELRYGDGEFRVIRPGRFVLCAVSGKKIPLEALKYWDPEHQEAFAGPKEALARFQERQGR